MTICIFSPGQATTRLEGEPCPSVPSLGRTRLAGLLRVLLRRLAVSLLRPSLAGRRLRRGHGC